MILPAVTGPIPGRASSSDSVAVFRLTSSPPDPPEPPVAPPRRRRSGDASSRDGTRTCAPSVSVVARLSSTPTRSTSTRGPNPPAASIASPTLAPVASRYTPGFTTAPVTSTTISPAAHRITARGRAPIDRPRARDRLAAPAPETAMTTARPPIASAPTMPAIARRWLARAGRRRAAARLSGRCRRCAAGTGPFSDGRVEHAPRC